MARGNINPITLEVMDMYSPSKVRRAHNYTATAVRSRGVYLWEGLLKRCYRDSLLSGAITVALSFLLQAPPPKSSSWACSAMGSTNKQYPVAVQAKLPMTTSSRLSRPFKPPTRSQGREKSQSRERDGVLRDDELMSLYSSSAPDQEEQSMGRETLKVEGPSLSK